MNFCLKNIFSYYVFNMYVRPVLLKTIHCDLCGEDSHNSHQWRDRHSLHPRAEDQGRLRTTKLFDLCKELSQTPQTSGSPKTHRNLILKEDISTTHSYSTEICNGQGGQHEGEKCIVQKARDSRDTWPVDMPPRPLPTPLFLRWHTCIPTLYAPTKCSFLPKPAPQ